ncbi:MAG TPA: CHAT domain-containing protein [Candidatus Limnocylindrales bacterium]|nr:CHAT domain-containing protein [Candidatus Limnocylindrales bacterium]
MPVHTITFSPTQTGNTWTDNFSLDSFEAIGAGLYEVVGNIPPCPIFTAWVVVDGPSPVTVANVAALGVLVVGVATAGAGLVAGARGVGGLARSVIGGAVAGLGALVLAQQQGMVPVDAGTLIAFTAIPGGLSGVTHTALGAIGRRRQESPGDTGPYYTPTYPGGQPVPSYPGAHSGPSYPSAPAPPYSGPPPAYDYPAYDTAAPPPPPPPPMAPPMPTTAPAPAPMAPTSPPPMAPPMPEPITPGATTTATPSATATATPGSSPTRGSHAATPPESTGSGAPPGAGASAGGSSGAGPAPATPQPPRESYAHIFCPETVVAEMEFELVVGLAAQPDRDVVGGPMVVPERIVGPYTMTIQVIADGFRLTRPHETWRADLRVTAEAPYPTTVLHLAADEQTRPVVAQSIRAMYSIDGQAVGLAARPIAVVREASLVASTPPPPAAEPVDIMLPTDSVPPDLTVRIEVGQPAGRLLLQLLAGDPQVVIPSEPLVVDIGNEPGLFLRDIIRKMNAAEGQPGMYKVLMGIGLTIADQLPTEFWDVVAAVGKKAGDRPPTILFLSAEPYVPWELAVMEPPLDAALPPFLAAQASVGRWVLGQRRPKLPPPTEVKVGSIAVVSGVYNLPGWDRLIDAEQEADELATTYGAAKVNAASQDVLRLVGGNPPADLLHFAVHGQYDPNGAIDGIVLVDGLTLDPMQVKGSPLASRPFVFLNACQVGSGEQVLGDYAGMAEAFLFAGASGVIAPLWSIDDVMARELALRFYEKALTGRTPADILREERAAFIDDPATISSTYLAYQYFGHPHMTIARAAG